MAGLKCVADREEANGSLKQRRLNSSRSWAFKGWQNLDRKVQIRPPSLGNGKNVPVEGVGGVEVPKGGESWLAGEKVPGGGQRAARNSGEYGRWEGRIRFGCFDRSLLGGQRERPAGQGSVGKGLCWFLPATGPLPSSLCPSGLSRLAGRSTLGAGQVEGPAWQEPRQKPGWFLNLSGWARAAVWRGWEGAIGLGLLPGWRNQFICSQVLGRSQQAGVYQTQ